MDAVKSFFEIDEVDYQGCLIFKALFNYNPQGEQKIEQFVHCRIAPSESQPVLPSTCCQHVLVADLAGLSRTPFQVSRFEFTDELSL